MKELSVTDSQLVSAAKAEQPVDSESFSEDFAKAYEEAFAALFEDLALTSPDASGNTFTL